MEGANYVLENIVGAKYIKIFCDSQAALQALTSKTCLANTVLDTHNMLNQLAQHHKTVRVHWIKAHVRMAGNELAD